MHCIRELRRTARFALVVFILPMTLAGCGGGRSTPERTNMNQPAPRTGMSGKQKVAILVGAAALYYVYKTYKQQKENAPQNVREAVPPGVQLYRSESTGAIYYRNPRNPKDVHWLTLPQNRIEVPQSDYDRTMSERNQWQNMPVPDANTPPPGSGRY
jgi:hypothetical protein